MFFAFNPSARPRSLWRTAVSLKVAATIVGGTLTLLASGLNRAQAAESDLPTKRVSYGDLNLRAPEGRATLERRIKVAARQVCGVESERPMIVARRKSCVRQSAANALAEVDRTAVLADSGR